MLSRDDKKRQLRRFLDDKMAYDRMKEQDAAREQRRQEEQNRRAHLRRGSFDKPDRDHWDR